MVPEFQKDKRSLPKGRGDQSQIMNQWLIQNYSL